MTTGRGRVHRAAAAMAAVMLTLAGACKGPAGPAGPAGEQGPAGDKGKKGKAGVDGNNGGNGQNGDDGDDGEDYALGFGGSSSCMACHGDHYAQWINSAHANQMVPAADAKKGIGIPDWVQELQGEEFAVDVDFFTDQAAVMTIDADTFPNGGWDDVSYAIGGYGWKARFLGLDGYFITGQAGDNVQYNLPFDPDYAGVEAYGPVGPSGAEYHPDTLKPFDCGSCHTTGWVADEDADSDKDLDDNQDGLEGIHGTWVEPGVGCEACHGPSLAHSLDPHLVATSRDPDTSCAGCHVQDDPYRIETEGGYIASQGQFAELVNSQHGSLQCGACHDAHAPVRYAEHWVAVDGDTYYDPNPDAVNPSGIRTACETCHFDEAASYASWAANFAGMEGVGCVDCHMPRAVQSAVAVGTYGGDVASHLFGINLHVDPIADPSAGTTGANPANPYLTVEWTCGGCHSDTAEGSDVVNPDLYVWASDALMQYGGIHGP